MEWAFVKVELTLWLKRERTTNKSWIIIIKELALATLPGKI